MRRKRRAVRAGGLDQGRRLLPETITDAVEAQEAIREADLVFVMGTLLRSVAAGNCLPSSTKVICVDINQATVTQLVDRGSAQAVGIVTDIETFVTRPAEAILGE